MGQKVNPHGFRVGVIDDWDSKWFADKDYQKYLLEDIKIREFIKDKQFQAGISRVAIERTEQKMRISIYTAKPFRRVRRCRRIQGTAGNQRNCSKIITAGGKLTALNH